MKKIGLLPLMIIAGSCFCIYLLINSKKQSPIASLLPEATPVYKADNLEETDDPDKRLEFEISITRDPATGKVPVERLLKAAEFRDQKFLRQATEGPNAAVPGISWAERGPSNIGGRTRALLYDLNGGPGYTKVWAGGVGGGLWFTNDISAATPVWTKVNDFFSNIAVTALAQNPVNNQIMYFGTGEGFFNADNIQGLGIWKTTDGGTNWTQLASTNNITFGFIQKIIVAGNDTVIACTLNGIQRSVNGGTSWTTVLSNGVGGGSTIRAADVELASNGRMYAAMGIFSRDGIYRSADSGATWTKIYASLVDEQRIEIACAPSNVDSIVALSQISGSNGIKKIMFTGDATAPVPTWTTVANPTWCDQGSSSADFTRTQAWYDLIAAFNPADAKSVTIGGVDMMRTNNSGAVFSQLSQWAAGCGALPVVHADIHAIAYKPGSATEFIVGCDGGIYRTTNNGTAFTARNSSYNVTQYYSAAISPTTTNFFLGGTQDNGSHRFNAAGVNSVTTVTGGDGGFAHIDQNNHNLQFTAYTNNNINVSTNGGTSFVGIALGGGSFISPSDFDDRSNVLYASNASGSFKRWNNPAGPNGPYRTVTCAAFAGSVSHVSVSPLTVNRVYFGTSNGKVVRVNDAHTGTAVTGTVIFTHPSLANISCITVDPGNENHMLVTASNYGVVSIYESVNATSGSPTFSSVEGDLPDMPVRWVIFDPRNNDWALVATELGVWSTDNLNSGGVTDWEPTNTNFANTRVDMLQYRASDGTILAATHGRGMFTAVVPISKSILFQDPGNSNTESSVTGTVDCRGYQDFVIPMIVTAAPVGNATVTLSASGTAVAGVDYDFTTNGNFLIPSNVLTFTSGSATPQNFTLRVYDDDIVESIENIVFTFAVSGATDAIKSNYNSNYVFAISDNDANSFAAGTANYTIGINSATTYMIGVNGSGSVNNNRARVQFLYLASELQAAGMKAGLINNLQFTVAQKNSSAAYEGFTVSIGNTATATLGGGFIAAGLTEVFNANFSTVAGANTITFGSAFSWDGTSNLVVQFCHDNTTAMNSDYVNGTSLLANPYFQVARAQTAAGVGCTLGAQYVYTDRMDMTFNSTTNGTSIESVLNSSKISNVVSGNNYNFYSSADNELVLSLNNPSANLGCVTARIDEQGAVWQAYLGGERSQKVFEVTPTTGAGSNYNITVYFTNTELAGKAPASLRLVKTTAASAAAATSANSVVVTPTTTDFGTYVSFSGSFTGFSRYFLVTAAVTLPVTLTEFTGRLNNDSRSVLNWKTAAEYNTSEFVVERALDGVHFEDIGSVRAKGSSNTTVSYALTDPYIAEKVNYYRLRIIDFDGKFKYSEIVIIRNPLNKLKDIRVVNNPFRDYIELMFTELPDAKIELTLRDLNGKLYYRRSGVSVNTNHLRLDLSSINLTSGSYVLELINSSQRMSFKVIRQ